MLNRSIISTLLSVQPHEQDHEVTKQWPGVGRQGVTDSRAKEPTQEFSSRPWSLSASSLESIDSYSLLGLGPGCAQGSWRNFHSRLEFWPLQPSPCLVSLIFWKMLSSGNRVPLCLFPLTFQRVPAVLLITFRNVPYIEHPACVCTSNLFKHLTFWSKCELLLHLSSYNWMLMLQ